MRGVIRSRPARYWAPSLLLLLFCSRLALAAEADSTRADSLPTPRAALLERYDARLRDLHDLSGRLLVEQQQRAPGSPRGLVGAAPDRRSKALKARNPGQAKLRVLVDADDARAALERGARSSALAARAR